MVGLKPSAARLAALVLGALSLPAAATAGQMESDGTCKDRAPADLIRLQTASIPLVIRIAPSAGGEMVSMILRAPSGDRELLYRGGNYCPTKEFEGKAPILWPATGRTYLPDADGRPPARGWLWEGRIYDMPAHGFARDLPWRVVEQDLDGPQPHVTLELVDNAATRKLYPFGFSFQVEYRLLGAAVSVRHRIRAADNNPGAMPFSLGNHIAFALPSPRAYLTTPATHRLLLDAQGRPTGGSESIASLVKSSLEAFTGRPAVPLAGYARRPWARLDLADGVAIRIDHWADREASGTPVHFNMWGDLEKGFFSPEPWWGKQNALATGDGLVRLGPGESMEWTFRVSIER